MLCVKIEKNKYVDSLETLFTTGVLNDQKGIDIGFVNMASKVFKETLKTEGMLTPEIENLSDSDFVIVASCDSQTSFDNAISVINKDIHGENKESKKTYSTISDGFSAHKEANLCSIAVPGEYALEEVEKALDLGLHCVVFSNNVPLEDERKMKEKAREKGLLCMGPDCGVANINGSALVLASINNRGPFGICGATGTGIQHVAAILHQCGTGVSQTIGTGGNDLKEKVGGIMMQMGIEALEADSDTKYIILISRKPADSVLEPIFKKIEKCTKPVVVFFMGCSRESVEKIGGIYASNLDDCAEKALNLIGKTFKKETKEDIRRIAEKATEGMPPSQKYLRGLYTGGTYMDEAMRAMSQEVGDIYSNAPLEERLRLSDSTVTKENSCIDYGEEEFTQGRPHPAIDPSIRKPFILKEAEDKEVAVMILDFILTPPGHMDPCGYVLEDVKRAMRKAEEDGRKLVVIAVVLGTDADIQNKSEQVRKMEEAGVIVAKTNYSAALIASEIVKIQRGKAL